MAKPASEKGSGQTELSGTICVTTVKPVHVIIRCIAADIGWGMSAQSG
jgi:hypothetical protein